MSARLPLRALAQTRALLRPAVFPSASPVARRLASTQNNSSKAAPAETPAKEVQPEAPVTDAATTEKTKTAVATEKKDGKGGEEAKDPYAVPPLSRPLGVHTQPTTKPLTWAEKKAQMLDTERNKAMRKELFKEAAQGYFHDYNLARKANGGKLWIAPPVLIREDRALYFPDITGKALTGKETHTTDLFEGKVSLVSILNTRISEEHTKGFVQPVLEDWARSPHFRYIELNHQPNPLKSMLVSFFASSLKRQIPEDRWNSYLISSGEWSEIDIGKPLGMENKLLGYVYLVDQNCKIRWAGCGSPRPEEVEHLRRATAVLIRRISGQGQQ